MSNEWSQRALEVIEQQREQFIILLDRSLRLMWIGDGVHDLLGWEGDDKIGRDARAFVHSNDFLLLQQAQFQSNQFPIEIRLKGANDEWCPCSLRRLSTTDPRTAMYTAYLVSPRRRRSQFELAVDLLGTDTPLDLVLSGLAASVNALLPRTKASIMIGTRTVDATGPSEPWLPPEIVYGNPSHPMVQLITMNDSNRAFERAFRQHAASSAWVVPIHLPSEPRVIGALACLNNILDPSPSEVEEVLKPTARLAGIASKLHTSRAELEHLVATDPVTGLANHRRIDDWITDVGPDVQQVILKIDVLPWASRDERFAARDVDFILVEIARRIASSLRGRDFVTRGEGRDFVVVLSGIVTRADAERVVQRIRTFAERPVGVAGRIVEVGLNMGIETRLAGEAIDDVLLRVASKMHSADPGHANVS